METESVEVRLAKLEEKLARAERRYRLVLAGLGMAVIAAAVSWVVIGAASRAQAQKPGEATDVIRAKKFVLEDWNGEARAMLYMTNVGPSLGLLDVNGNTRVILAGGSTESGLYMYDDGDIARMKLSLNTNGPSVDLADGKGTTRVSMPLSDELQGLVLYDEKGKANTMLVGGGERGPLLALVDVNSKALATLTVTKTGEPRVNLCDKAGTTRAELGMLKGESWLLLGDENNTRAALGVTKAGPGLRMDDEDKKPRVELDVLDNGPRLRLKDEHGKAGAMMCMSSAGPALSLQDEDENVRALIGVTEGKPLIGVSDESGRLIWSAP